MPSVRNTEPAPERVRLHGAPRGWRWRGATLSWSLLLLATLGLAACGKKSAPETAPRTVITAIAVAVGSAADPAAGSSTMRAGSDNARLTDAAPAASAVDSGASMLTGIVAARTETSLSFRVGGLLQARPFQAGDRVARGALLARLDDADAQAQVGAADTAARTARDNLRLAVIQRDRDRKQADAGLIAPTERERSEQQALSAEADNARAQQQRTAARNQLRYQQIVAEQSGVITDVRAEPGQTVAAGQIIYTYAVDGPRDFVVQAGDATLATLRVGLPATIQLSAQPTRRFPAHVREIAAAASPRSPTYTVKFAFDHADDIVLGMSGTVIVPTPASGSPAAAAADAGIASSASLPKGTAATVDVAAAGPATAVTIPATALFHRQGQPAVWVVDASTHAVGLRPVDVARYDAQAVILRAGLHPGEQVVSRGVNVLSPGTVVTPHVDDGRAVLASPAPDAAASNAPTDAVRSADAVGATRMTDTVSAAAGEAADAGSARAGGTTR